MDSWMLVAAARIYVRCTGTGSPTVILEGGDEDTSSSYSYAEADLAAVTRTCVYDRANLGASDADPGPRGLAELVADFEGVLEAANIPGPYVLVGTSGGGYISAGYAVKHPREVAGIVFVEVPSPFRNPPARDRGGHPLGLTGQHREPRLPPGGEGRLGGTDSRSATSRSR